MYYFKDRQITGGGLREIPATLQDIIIDIFKNSKALSMVRR